MPRQFMGRLQRIGHQGNIVAFPQETGQFQHRAPPIQINGIARLNELQCRFGNAPLLASRQRGLVSEHRLIQPAVHAHRPPVHPPNGAAALQLVQIPPHRRCGNLQLAAKVLDPDHAPIANQRPQIVPPLRRQRFLIGTRDDVF